MKILGYIYTSTEVNHALTHLLNVEMPFIQYSPIEIDSFYENFPSDNTMDISSLRSSKAFVAFGVQENASFFSNVIKGATILP